MKKLRVNISMDKQVKETAQKLAKEDRRYGISSLIEYLIMEENKKREQQNGGNVKSV